ncbi:helix-turn-helix transcriptional regulator [Lachnospiraceae bacterium 46-61]
MEIDKELFGNKIKTLRESKKWTQKDLGIKIGVDQSNITKMEKGKKFISMDTAYKIMEVFNISFDDLFEDVLIGSQNAKIGQNNLDDLFSITLKNNLSVMSFKDLKMIEKLIKEVCNYPQSSFQEQEPPQ